MAALAARRAPSTWPPPAVPAQACRSSPARGRVPVQATRPTCRRAQVRCAAPPGPARPRLPGAPGFRQGPSSEPRPQTRAKRQVRRGAGDGVRGASRRVLRPGGPFALGAPTEGRRQEDSLPAAASGGFCRKISEIFKTILGEQNPTKAHNLFGMGSFKHTKVASASHI